MTVDVKTLTTRNPHSVIFKLDRDLIPPGTGLSFPNAASAKTHPLANTLFQIQGVVSVWILGDEVQVTKEDGVRWSSIQSKVVETLRWMDS